MAIQRTFNGNIIQWSFNGNSMNIQWQFNDHSMAIQWTFNGRFNEHSMTNQWTFNGTEWSSFGGCCFSPLSMMCVTRVEASLRHVASCWRLFSDVITFVLAKGRQSILRVSHQTRTIGSCNKYFTASDFRHLSNAILASLWIAMAISFVSFTRRNLCRGSCGQTTPRGEKIEPNSAGHTFSVLHRRLL